jgi:hypothetical protein
LSVTKARVDGVDKDCTKTHEDRRIKLCRRAVAVIERQLRFRDRLTAKGLINHNYLFVTDDGRPIPHVSYRTSDGRGHCGGRWIGRRESTTYRAAAFVNLLRKRLHEATRETLQQCSAIMPTHDATTATERYVRKAPRVKNPHFLHQILWHEMCVIRTTSGVVPFWIPGQASATTGTTLAD